MDKALERMFRFWFLSTKKKEEKLLGIVEHFFIESWF